ncbi:MAG: hypothetical protein KatS3mg031_2314 [Chitinophagales bacterium]|nr:MAG: hypothetical protein KatS3mg031_2314 [Chitinophagales bacterium]
MKSSFILSILLFGTLILHAQDDNLLKLLEEKEKEDKPKKEFVTATFKATRIVNGYSVELPAKYHLQFYIAHRFGNIFDNGWREFFGIDNADMRIGGEYGITDWLSAGWGRSSVGGTFDFMARVKFLRQSKSPRKIPLTMVWFSDLAISSAKMADYVETNHRLSYAHQLLIARKFTRSFSLQIMPTYIHWNLTQTPQERNDQFSLGIGGRLLVTPSIGLNLEYFQPLIKTEDGRFYVGSLGFALDIETGGHVFQITITNSTGMIDQLYQLDNGGYWWDKYLRLGFNIHRNISFVRG